MKWVFNLEERILLNLQKRKFMESLTIYLKNKEQVDFLNQLLQHLDFVVMPAKISKRGNGKRKEHSIFSSAGIWANRNITQEDLRAKAWKRS